MGVRVRAAEDYRVEELREGFPRSDVIPAPIGGSRRSVWSTTFPTRPARSWLVATLSLLLEHVSAQSTTIGHRHTR